MEITTVTVSSKGQVAIPSRIREIAGVKQGDVFVVAATEEGILLMPSGALAEKAAEEMRTFRDASLASLKRMDPDDERWSKALARRHLPARRPVRRRKA